MAEGESRLRNAGRPDDEDRVRLCGSDRLLADEMIRRAKGGKPNARVRETRRPAGAGGTPRPLVRVSGRGSRVRSRGRDDHARVAAILATSRRRKQPTTWSLTMPTA